MCYHFLKITLNCCAFKAALLQLKVAMVGSGPESLKENNQFDEISLKNKTIVSRKGPTR
jgi:hypothetical protein